MSGSEAVAGGDGLSCETAQRIVARAFGLVVEAQPLPGERDLNFRCYDADGRQHVLKVHHPTADPRDLELQNAVLAHLSERLPRRRWPRPVRSLAGEEICRWTDGDGRPRAVRLLDFLPGRFLAEVHPRPAPLLRSLGNLLGEMDRVLATFVHPAMDRDLLWDLEHGVEVVRRHAPAVAEPERRRLVETVAERFERGAAEALPTLRRSVVHHDANDHNVLVADDGRVDGLIDFGDTLRSFTVSEPAIAAAYALLDEADPLSAAAEVVAGYNAAWPLETEECDVLLDFILLRLAVSVTLSTARSRSRPENPYLRISERPAWRALGRLVDLEPAVAARRFRDAAGRR